jgi:hypothetical protein
VVHNKATYAVNSFDKTTIEKQVLFNRVDYDCDDMIIAFITRHKVNIVDTEVRMVFLGGHPAKY